jgi:hypothetical protein
MKKVAFIIIVLTILLQANLVSASSFFEIMNVSTIKMVPNSETNFTVTVKDLGSKGGYVDLVFRNLSTNLSVIQNGGTKYISSGATNSFNGTIKAGDVAPDNYTFEMGLSAKGSPYNWRKAYIVVEPAEEKKAELDGKKKENIRTLPTANNTTSSNKAKDTPGTGILVAIAAILITSRRIRS